MSSPYVPKATYKDESGENNFTIMWDLSNYCFHYLGKYYNFNTRPDSKSETIIRSLMAIIDDLKKKNEELEAKISELPPI